MRKVLLIVGILLTSCYKDHLYVQQEWVDRNFLASTHIGSPDPRQENPPSGQRILVAWRFPIGIVHGGLQLCLTVRFWDQEEKTIHRPIQESRGSTAFGLFEKKILTYKVDVIDSTGCIVESWEHQFWTRRVDVDLKSSSVSSQPRHESVIDTP